MNWVQVASSLAGAGLVTATVVSVLRLRKWRRDARNERPPQSEKLLRPAGYSAMNRMDKAADALMDALVQAVSAGLVLGLTLGTFYPIFQGLASGHFLFAQIWTPPLRDPAIASAALAVVALSWLLWKGRAVLKLAADVRNWRFGLRGEQAVAEKLADRSLAAAGYSAFHDVPGTGDWNIDHIVVGPGGVFVLETKARPRRKAKRQQPEHVVEFDGSVLQFPSCYDDEAVKQVERNAKWVREFLEAFPPKNIPVQPVIVLPGWFVKTQGNFRVKVMNANYLISFLKQAKPFFTIEQLEPIIQRLDERCRTVEF